MPCIPTAQPCQVLTFCHIWFKIFFPRDNITNPGGAPGDVSVLSAVLTFPPSTSLPADASTPAP